MNLSHSCILIKYNLQDIVIPASVLHLILPAHVRHNGGEEGHLCAGNAAPLHGGVDVFVDHIQLMFIVTG